MKQILFFGDSLTAGYGLIDPSKSSLPALIQAKILDSGFEYIVKNAGVSGDTSGAGLIRLNSIISLPVDIFVLELGANDLLRGYAPNWTKDNLQRIISRIKVFHPSADILLLGMRLPDWVPGERPAAFRALYQQLADENGIALLPFLLDGVAGIKHLNMADGLHPLAEGYKIIASNVWPKVFEIIKNQLKRS